MTLADSKHNDIEIVKIIGEVDIYNCSNLKQLFLTKLEEGYKKFLFNMEELTYIDSSGIGVLIFIKTTIQKNGGIMTLTGVKESVRKIFDLTKLSTFFNIFEEEAEGIAFLSDADNK